MQLLICKHFFTQPQLKSKTAWTLSKNWHSAPMFETHQIKKATTSFVSFLYSTKTLWMNKASKHCKDTKQMRMSAFQNWCIAHKSAKQQPSERVHIILLPNYESANRWKHLNRNINTFSLLLYKYNDKEKIKQRRIFVSKAPHETKKELFSERSVCERKTTLFSTRKETKKTKDSNVAFDVKG